jgi:hypothetical protein
LKTATELYSILRSQFETLKASGELYSSKTLSLGVKIREVMNQENPVYISNLFHELKRELPLSVQVVAWSKNTHIYNRRYSKEYLYGYSDGKKYDNYERRLVYLWVPGGRHDQGRWEFTTEDGGETFKIRSIHYKEFLYAAGDGYAKNPDRRRVFTWQKSTCDNCEWFVEIVSNNEIRLKFKTYGQYFYALNEPFGDERIVFTKRSSTKCGDECVWRLSPEGE